MHALELVKRLLGEITEIALLLVALGIVAQILFATPGETLPFVGGVVANLTEIIDGLGQNGLVGLIAMSIILFLFYRKRAPV